MQNQYKDRMKKMEKQIKKNSNINGRDLALSMLLEIYAQKEFSHMLLRQVLDKYDYLEGKEKAFIKRLTEGTIERTIELDYVINQFSKVPVSKMKPLIRTLLRMSVYQILYMDQIPDSAVCNEAVKLASMHKFTSLKGFVNGVLRSIARKKTEIKYPDKSENEIEYYSVVYSMPVWLVEHFWKAYGSETCEKICAGLLRQRPVTVRIREDLSEDERISLCKKWEEHGIQVTQTPYLSYAFLCEKMEGLRNMEGYEEGLFAVQDVSSMLVSEVAGIKPGMHMIDVCAAPGGKSTHAAMKLQGTGQVLARDISDYKVQFIEENAKRQHLDNIKVQVWDATIFDPKQEQKADILFVDAPCSGLGVMGKKRDIKYRMNPGQLEEIIKLQREILDTVWPYVKKGGFMMYSTCTINKQENEEQVQWFTKNYPFEVVSMKEELPGQLSEYETEWGLQLLPGIHDTDGFFLVKLRRKE